MTVIGLSGYARAGKDTVVDHLVKHHGYERVAFADKLREFALAVNPIVPIDSDLCDPLGIEGHLRLQEVIDRCGWHRAKDLTEVRGLLQRIGTEAGRNVLHQDVWVDAAMRTADEIDRVAFSDCRFPNEADAISANGGYIIRVVRPGVDAANGHISEHALDDYQVDGTIWNDGTLDDIGCRVEAVLTDLGIL